MREYDFWGAPFDGGATLGWPGARYAPDAIRASLPWLMGRIEDGLVHWLEAGQNVAVDGDWFVDRGDVPVVPADLQATLRACADAVGSSVREGRVPIFVGGDDSTLVGAVTGYHDATEGVIGLVYLDAHYDLSDGNGRQGRFSQSSGMRRCLELDRVAPTSSIQVGLRNFNFPSSAAFAAEVGLETLTAQSCCAMGMTDTAQVVLAAVSDADHVFLAIDIDVVDPAAAPGAGAHEPGGFSSREVLDLLHELAPHCDALAVTEVNPMVDPQGTTARLAATILTTFALTGRAREGTGSHD